MKKVVFVLALIALALPMFAQEFPDVPPDHWAYQAVQELVNAGIIQGYPDGTYGGKRAMTRYEFAEAVAKAIPAIEEKCKGIAGPAGPAGAAGAAGPAGPPGVTPEQLQAMQKLIDEFRDELAALGVDVEALRRDVAALCERVAALENEVARVKITGAANLLARGEVSNQSAFVYDRDNRLLASITASDPTPADRDNPLANSRFFNDLDFNVKGRVSENASLNSTIALGNYLNWVLERNGDLSKARPGTLNDFTLWNLNFNGAVRLPLLGMTHLTVGRFPFQLTPFTLKFVNPDSYNFNEKLAAGDYPLDGASALFNWSKASLSLFAAKAGTLSPGDLLDQNLSAANWLLGGVAPGLYMPQLAGARLIVGTGMGGNLGLTYYQAGMASTVGRAGVFGADLNIQPGQLGFAAEYANIQANDQFKTTNPTVADNTNAWKAKLSYAPAKLGVGVGYIDVGSGYRAPGSWVRLGRAINLTNVKGWQGDLSYKFSNKLNVCATGSVLTPKSDAFDIEGRTAVEQGPRVDIAGASVDQVSGFEAWLKYGLTGATTLELGWEQDTWSPVTAIGTADTTEKYYSVGLRHAFNQNSFMRLLYQIVDFKSGPLDPIIGSTARGGVAVVEVNANY